jgi:ribonuclease E
MEPREDNVVALQAQPAAEPAEAVPPSEPEPEPIAVVLTPPDPERPKRAGWWSKAKSVLSGS